MNKIVQILFCHLLGDYLFQTPYIAESKGKNWYHMFVHCVLYCLPFYICFGLNWQLILLFLSHFCIDVLKARYNLITICTDQLLHYIVMIVYFL